MRIGLDVGSTTLKCVVLSEEGEIVYQDYQRHLSQISEKTLEMLKDIEKTFPTETKFQLNIAGSAGMGLAEKLNVPFVQEVYATQVAVKNYLPETDVVIELGGEDAKILFLSGLNEVRMNGSCAGGTGAFIDQMATLLNVDPNELNNLAGQYEKIYTIASRCGVFAKSDVQPLLNQGAQKSDIAASIFAAVVNQTIAGLAQGRKIEGNVVYLGGPLTFMSQLQALFDKFLKVEGIKPENSLYFVCIGAALSETREEFPLTGLIKQLQTEDLKGDYVSCTPLFTSIEDYKRFKLRHAKANVKQGAPLGEEETIYIGIDAGSTTVKAVAINEKEEILISKYMPNNGNPIPIMREFLLDLYEKYPSATIKGATSTGYGEDIIKNAFHLDFGIVETVAHFTGAMKFDPEVDAIIDIGGQDMKCVKIRNGTIDNIFLNEACSSGCGSFLQTFAGALGVSVDQFATMGLYAETPVDLGSRCTVFMNSSVKQAQKDGASVEDISAGLSISVVKNALYKVIRLTDGNQLGNHIVVQGGTFLNDAVLRAFEQETGHQVIRPNIAGLMGAYGAALYSKSQGLQASQMLTKEQLLAFTHKVKATTCGLCSNHCNLTVNTFDGGRSFIGGNRCQKPLMSASERQQKQYNMYDYKRELLKNYKGIPSVKGRIGIPMVLNMFELLPYWHTFFTSLGYEVVVSPTSTRSLYFKGQHTIPSDTVCYPAKLVHGHIEELREAKVDKIFYPNMSYNFDEQMGDNHYNCPVVAYYPEVIRLNVSELTEEEFISDYVGPHMRKEFPKKMLEILERNGLKENLKEVKLASDLAYSEYEKHMERIRKKGEEYLAYAEENDLPVVILSGRPYHLDEEINHGIDGLICEQGAVVISEDAVAHLGQKADVNVLNQWTYHARLYSAAKFIGESHNNKMNMVQLVSFGCGLDAITSDEIRDLLEDNAKIYTQIKIDEITNLGTVKIRLRSLFAAIDQLEGRVLVG